MRQLLPPSAAAAGAPSDEPVVDPVEVYLAASRRRPADRPWFTVGMVASIDGATAVDGTSGALGGDADKAVFRAVRAIADVILVGAGTLRTEGYGPVRYSEAVRAARQAVGRDPEPPRLAVVTGSLDLDFDGDLFRSDRPPIVFTTTDADERQVAAAEAVTDVHRVGEGHVDLGGVARVLHTQGVGIVVCEGGPSLNGALVAAGLVDEVCLSLAPQVAGGDSARIVAGAEATDVAYRIDSLLEADDVLFARWVRD